MMRRHLEAAEKKNSKIKGIWLEEDYVRKYPYNTLCLRCPGIQRIGECGEQADWKHPIIQR